VYIRCSLNCFVICVLDCPAIAPGGSTIAGSKQSTPISTWLYYRFRGLFSNKFKYRPSLAESTLRFQHNAFYNDDLLNIVCGWVIEGEKTDKGMKDFYSQNSQRVQKKIKRILYQFAVDDIVRTIWFVS
jgi:hypothetical protein